MKLLAVALFAVTFVATPVLNAVGNNSYVKSCKKCPNGKRCGSGCRK